MAAELPQEILIDIFSRLPAKSVGQCRCLSKPWYRILSRPQFIKSHLNQKTHQQSLLLIDESRSLHSIAAIKDGAVSRELELPGCTQILGSCHGLVLLGDDEGYQFLVNPVTLDKVVVPKSPLALKDGEKEVVTMYGFGYDSSIDDYKIVTLSYYKNDDEDEFERDHNETFVDVYFAKRDVWKRTVNSPYNLAVIPLPHPGAFLNGAIHWLARTRQSSVFVAFSLFDEVFTEIPAPNDNDLQMGNFWYFHPMVLGGCLCIVDVENNERTDVWMLKEYGLVKSWTRIRGGTSDQRGIGKPLCFVGNQEIVSIVEEGGTLGVYNPKEGTLRDLIVDRGVPTSPFEDGIAFVPSLVAPAYVDVAYCNTLSSDVLYEMSAANMARTLSLHRVLALRLHDYETTISALEHSVNKSREDKEELESELRQKSRELSALTRAHKKKRRRLSEKLAYERRTGASFLSSDHGKAYIDEMCRQSVEAYKASTESRVESGQENEDVVMLVGPDAAEVAIDKGAGPSSGSMGC